MQNTNLGTLNPNNYPVSSSINTNAPNIYPSNNPGSTINYGAAYPSSSVVNMPGVISGSNVGGISSYQGSGISPQIIQGSYISPIANHQSYGYGANMASMSSVPRPMTIPAPQAAPILIDQR